jgi:ribosomal protein S18 acetylase RimI-like enzyme
LATSDARWERAAPADGALLLEMVREFYAHERLRFRPGRTDAALAAILADERFGRVWIARSGGAAAGYLVMTLGFSLEFGGRDAFVDELWIREPFRGAGLGRLAVATAEEACRELGVHALHLEVDHVNTGAQRLYRALGFEDHDRYLLTRWVDEDAPPKEDADADPR